MRQILLTESDKIRLHGLSIAEESGSFADLKAQANLLEHISGLEASVKFDASELERRDMTIRRHLAEIRELEMALMVSRTAMLLMAGLLVVSLCW